MEKITEIIKKYKLNIVVFIIIFIIAIFLRTYKLESIPSELMLMKQEWHMMLFV